MKIKPQKHVYKIEADVSQWEDEYCVKGFDQHDNYILLFKCNYEDSASCCGIKTLRDFDFEERVPKGCEKEFADKFVTIISNDHGLVQMEFATSRNSKEFYAGHIMNILLKHGGFKKGPRFVNPKTGNTVQQIYAVINQP